MIDTLTQEQQWGWAYLLQEHNRAVDRSNQELIDTTPEGETPPTPQPLLTMDQYLLLRLGNIGSDGYAAILRAKEQQALQMFYSLSPQQQEALLKQFGVPDVLTG